MKKILLLFFYTFWYAVGMLSAQQSQRLIKGWEFVQQDLGGIWEAVRPVPAGAPEASPIWQNVQLPHSFNQTDAVSPLVNYYQGPGWYRTYLDLNNPYVAGRTLLHFEGAGQKTQVYVYKEKVKEHVGGYDEWYADLTDAVARFRQDAEAVKRFGGKVPISIRVDNTRDLELMPSDLSDFNVYGGLYRYVNLVYTPALSVEQVFAHAEVDAKGKEGKVTIRARFRNPQQVGQAQVRISLLDPQGKEVGKQTLPIQLRGDDAVIDVGALALKNPNLWSTIHPNLYKLSVTVITDKDNATLSQQIGFRHFEFQEKGPFMLNGKRLLLNGTHRHEDHAGVGPAMTEEQIWTEMRMMKEMGVNFIRLGHYQQSRIVLEACDALGILVWEEIPWCRGGLGGEVYQEQGRRMLTNMIEQHFNHASVIIWGLGNENDWPGDFDTFDKEKIREYMKELNDLSHQLDPSRKTAIRRCDFCKDIVDVYSPSIWAGWYRGVYTDYKSVSEKEFNQVNHFLHVEWGGDSHARRHSETPDQGLSDVMRSTTADERAGDASLFGGPARVSKDGDWSESYIVNLIDWHLKEQETMPWLTGTAYWPFKDFSTPIRPENPVPYVNQKGVVERNLTKKESFYVFQSYWTEEPMAHIYGHNWPVRWGEAGQERMVKVFSNCDEAELFVNGISQGVRKRNSQDFPAAGLRWMVAYKEGENKLEVVAKKGKTVVKDAITQVYQTATWGKPTQVSLEVIAQKGDSLVLEAYLRDAQGVKCLDARDYINFQSLGEGYLIVDQGTSDGSSRLQAYNGRARITFVRTGAQSVVSVHADSIGTAVLNLSQPVLPKQVYQELKKETLHAADSLLTVAVKTIVDAPAARSAGTVHDFYSEGDYWWPNPANPDGPYIRNDGQTNPDNFVAHRDFVMRLGDIVGSLVAAWKVSADQKYIDAVVPHLEAWFVNPDTRMNPSLNYAQAIKGVATGRGIGIIDAIHFIEVAKGIQLLKEADKLPPSLLKGCEEWFANYLQWVTTHPYGLEEMAAKNNHGTCWVMQVAAFASLTENKELLAFCADRYKSVLLPNQLADDGHFPLEVERTKAYGYSLFNLDAFATTCYILKDFDPQLPYYNQGKKSLQQALTFLYPYLQHKDTWPFGKDVMYWEEWPTAQVSLLFGGLLFQKQEFLNLWSDLPRSYAVTEVKRNSPIRHPFLWL